MTMSRFEEDSFTGLLTTTVKALKEKQPLPSAGKMKKQEAVEASKHLMLAVPMRAELKDMLEDPQAFEPPDAQEALGSITLFFEPPDAQEVARCREEYGTHMMLMERKGPFKPEDRFTEIPVGPVTPNFVGKALEGITRLLFFTRKNVQPDGALIIDAFPMGTVLNYHRGLMCSRTLTIFPNLAKAFTTITTRTPSSSSP